MREAGPPVLWRLLPRAWRPRTAPAPRAVRARRGSVEVERGCATALLLLPLALVGCVLVGEIADDDHGDVDRRQRRTESVAGPSGHAHWSAATDAPGGGVRGDGGPRGAAGVTPPAFGDRDEVVVPDPGVRLPRFEVSLPVIELLLAPGGPPGHPAVSAPGAASPATAEIGSPATVLLAGLGGLAVATVRRARATERRVDRAASAGAAEAGSAVGHADPGAGRASPCAGAEVEQPSERPEPADPDLGGGTSSPAPGDDRCPSAAAPPTTRAEDPGRERLDALAARPRTGGTASPWPAPDDPGPGSGPGPASTPAAPPSAGAIIRAPRHGRVRR